MISVDQDACIGCGLCVGMCPEVFKMNSSGKSEAYQQKDSDEARDAAAGCPVNAITV